MTMMAYLEGTHRVTTRYDAETERLLQALSRKMGWSPGVALRTAVRDLPENLSPEALEAIRGPLARMGGRRTSWVADQETQEKLERILARYPGITSRGLLRWAVRAMARWRGIPVQEEAAA